MQRFEPGQIVRFTYDHPAEDEVTDRYKEVFVLNGNHLGKIHGLDMKLLTPADREVLQLLMDPDSKGKVHRIPIVNDILKRMDPLVEIKNPVAFYAKFVRPFLHGRDVYRSYWQQRMKSPTVVEKSQVTGAAQGTAVAANPKPLFHSVSPKKDGAPAAPAKKPLFSLPPLNSSRKGSTIKPRIQRPKRGKTV
jgi:hypothetical protein